MDVGGSSSRRKMHTPKDADSWVATHPDSTLLIVKAIRNLLASPSLFQTCLSVFLSPVVRTSWRPCGSWRTCCATAASNPMHCRLAAPPTRSACTTSTRTALTWHSSASTCATTAWATRLRTCLTRWILLHCPPHPPLLCDRPITCFLHRSQTLIVNNPRKHCYLLFSISVELDTKCWRSSESFLGFWEEMMTSSRHILNLSACFLILSLCACQ